MSDELHQHEFEDAMKVKQAQHSGKRRGRKPMAHNMNS